MSTAATTSPPNGMRKAAILLVLLGDDVASQIYRNLPEEELQQLTQEIAELKYIDPRTALTVLEEYHRLTVTQDYLAQGGTDYAQKLLVKAFGDEGARLLMSQVTRVAATRTASSSPCRKLIPSSWPSFWKRSIPRRSRLSWRILTPSRPPLC